MHRFKRGNGIEHAFALSSRGQLNLDIDHIGAKSYGGQFERDACACGRFGKHDGDGRTTQSSATCSGLVGGSGKVRCPLEQRFHHAPRQAIQCQKMPQGAISSQLFSALCRGFGQLLSLRFPDIYIALSASQRSSISAAAMLSTSVFLIDPRRCPRARKSFSVASASSDE